MRHPRRASFTLLLLALLLLAPAARAADPPGECPLAATGSGYRPDYASPIGLPRCTGTVAKWTPCEVCMLSSGLFSEKDAYTQSYTSAGGGLQPHATFHQGSASIPIDGFFDGLVDGPAGTNRQAIFRLRFTPTIGDGSTIDFTTTSPDGGLIVSGSFKAGPASPTSRGFLRRDTANPRNFIWDNGTYPFLWGQTLYQIVNYARLSDPTVWQTSVNESAKKGMNKLRLLVSPWGGDPIEPAANSRAFQADPVTKVLNRDILDIQHWRALDSVTSYLSKVPGEGMVADLILFHDGDNTSSPYAADNPAQNQRYTRYVASRYAAFTNVIWTLANEYQNVTADTGRWDELGCVIRGNCPGVPAADPWSNRRPLSIHNSIKPANNPTYPCFAFFGSGWPSDIALQTRRPAKPDAEAAIGVLRNSVNRSSCDGNSGSTQLPVFNDEYYYIGQNKDDFDADRVQHREASWAVAMSGGFGSTGDLHGVEDDRCLHPNNDKRCSPTLFTRWFAEPEPGPYKDILMMTRYFRETLAGLWPQMNASSRVSMVGNTRVYGLDAPPRYVVYAVRAQDDPVTKAMFILDVVRPGKYTYFFDDPTNPASLTGTEKRTTIKASGPTPFKSSRNPLWTDYIVRIVPKGSGGKALATDADETVWVADSLPAGAVTGGDSEGWTWIDDDPVPISDALAHTSNLVAGMHQHYFQNATETLPISAGNILYAYVYLDPLNPPSEVMLQWNDGNWDHRAYWGANQLGWGNDGTNSRRYMGPLPQTDRWVRLEVPASAVGLEGHTLTGMAFSLFGGKAAWDEAGRAGAFQPQCDDSAITQQPQSQTIIPGASATLTVAVTGTGPFNYQFYQSPVGTYNNPTGISTATINTGPLYTTKQYWAEINDTCQGTFLRSDAAVITVQCTAAPAITQQPTSRVTTPGQSTTLSVSAAQGVSYQWYQGSSPSTATPIANATGTTLTVAPQSSTSYWVRVTNGCGTADSVTATVCVLPAITAQPTPRTINPGQSTTLTVSAINAVNYQWYVGSASSTATPISGSSSSLTVSPMTTTNYWVRISNACGSVDSTTVTVTVAPAPLPQIARIQSVAVLANSQNSITARWTQPTQPGTFLVAVISGLKDPAALVWTAPAGWQAAIVEEWPNVKLAIYYLPNNAGARTAETFTVQQGYHDMTLYVAEYSGMMAVNPLDRTASTGDFTNNGYVQTGYTANTVQPKELVITGLSTYAQTEFTVSPTEGFTELYDQSMLYHLTTAMYEKITTTTGSYGHGATVSVPAEWVGVVATFRGANTN